VDFSFLEAQASHRAEHELLLHCLRPDETACDAERIRSLVTNQIDWNYLFLFAQRHAVVPLLSARLNKVAADTVPPLELQGLQKYFQQNSARNILLTAELCQLLELLGQEGIEAIPYKGPALALFAYGDLSLRRFVDLDIMVRKDDVAKSIELLLHRGYKLSKPFNANQQEVLLRTQHNLQFRGHKGQLIVELHWEVSSHLFASSLQAEDIWKTLITTELRGTTIKTFAPEDLIFSLTIHGCRHLWERLLWICDVGWIATRRQLNWEKLLERARRTKTERMMLLGLALSERLLSVDLPAVVADEIKKDRQLEKLLMLVVKELFRGPENQPAPPYKILEFNLKIRRSWSARARYFRYALDPTDRDLDALVLPRSLSFGYYLMRPVRLLFKTGEDVR